ncbi:MAG: nickel-dependent lactate racemase [Eubacteriales bacterium]
MKELRLGYGEGQVCLPVEGADWVEVLEENPMPVLEDVEEGFRQAMEHPIGGPGLEQVVEPGDQVTLVISDITRYWMRQDKLLPLLVERLNRLGVADEDMVVLIALGTHRPQTEAELDQLLTPELHRRLRVAQHDCDSADLVEVGTTSRGTVVRVHPLVVGRKVITMGATVHHLMAGFGGGRKSILPGVSARETILQNHLHSLSPDQPCSNPLIGSGAVEGNPLNEDMVEAAAMVAPVFGVNIVVDSHSRHSRFFCGHWYEAWRESCRYVQRHCGVEIPRKADVVIASCGGYPKDISLYQAVKTLFNAAQAVKEGGTLLFLAQCREGGGAPEFFGWIEPQREGRLDAALREGFNIPGYLFYAACEVTRRCQVRMLSSIPAQEVRDMGILAFDQVDRLLEGVDLRGKGVYVMPYGGSVVPFYQP